MNNQNPQKVAEHCAKALWDADEATQSLDMHLQHIAPGESSLSMVVTQSMCNGHGTCHGGFLFTLADSTFAFACNSYNQRAVAQHCSITYINPAQLGETLHAHACEVSRQGRSGIYDVAITDQTGNIIAQFRGHSRTIKGTVLPQDTDIAPDVQ